MSTGKLEPVFRPRARLLRLLGESLLRDEVIALIELVKNAHDADASFVEIQLHDVSGKEGKIVIKDDGSGMKLDKILGPWMEPGTDDKHRHKYTPSGRRVLGEKGIGRFAADKIAQKLELVTKTKDSKKEIYAVFDWSKYDDAVYLDQVSNHVEEREPEIIKDHGTELILSGLRTEWNRYMVDKLHMGLLRLVSPLRKVEGFEIRLIAEDFPDLAGEMREDIFEMAPYRIEARVNTDGKITYRLNNKETREFCFIKNKKEEAPTCGPFKAELYAWELTSAALQPLGIGVTKARQLIKSWSGVNIYRDLFRILPYGEQGEDWLELDRRRIEDPTVHFSRNQILGFVHLTSKSNSDVIDQTNREGLIQNAAYFDLREAVLQIMRHFENYRIELNAPKKKERMEKSATAMLDNVIDQLSSIQSPIVSDVVQNVIEAKQSIEEREEDIVEALSRYQRSLTIGQMAKNIIHEVKQPITTIIEESNSGLIALKREPMNSKFLKESFDIIKERSHFVDQIAAKWAPFIVSQRQKKKFNICEAIESVFSDYRGEISRINVVCEYPPPSSTVVNVEMDYADAVMVFRNLLSNSLYWLEASSAQKPKVRVTATTRNNRTCISFQDNGPGIEPKYHDKIFLPGWTLKENGYGLGLSIIGEILDYYGGKIELIGSRKAEYKGAHFMIDLPSA